MERPVVELVGSDGNAFAIMGKVGSALRRAGYPPAEVDKFRSEAMSGDYDNLLRVCMEWADIQ